MKEKQEQSTRRFERLLHWLSIRFIPQLDTDVISFNALRQELMLKLINTLIVTLFPIGFFFNFSYLASIDNYVLIVVGTFLYGTALYHLFAGENSLLKKPYIWALYSYLYLFFFMLEAGPGGHRGIWLMLNAIFLVLFYGLRSIPYSILFNLLFLTYFLYAVDPDTVHWSAFSSDFDERLSYLTNFTFFSILVTMSIGLFVHWFEKIFERMHAFQDQLQIERETLLRTNSEKEEAIEKILSEKKARSDLERNYRSLFSHAVNGIGMISGRGIILDINHQLCTMLSLDAETVKGRPFTDFIAASDHDRLLAAMSKLRMGVPLEAMEIRCIRSGGGSFTGLIRGWVMETVESEDRGFGFLLQDLTEQNLLKLERESFERHMMQAQKIEAVGTLAGGIAHDFNNIIAGIYGYAELALDYTTEEESQAVRYLQRIMEAVQRAKALVNQILQFSRDEDQVFLQIELLPVIQEALELIRSTIPTNIVIQSDFRTDKDLVLADSTRIHQVLVNLCTNAYHAMRDSGGSITVIVEDTEFDQERHTVAGSIPAGSYISVSVRDTGIGIPHEIMNRIFEPYFTTKDVHEGTGLGLAVTLGIIAHHKGGLEVRSEPGEGTVFTVYLPRSTEQTAASEQVLADSIPARGSGEEIVIVDDEDGILETLHYYLEHYGYAPRSFSNPLEARDYILSRPAEISMLITDNIMPQMTGLELCNDLKNEHGLKIPIVLITGYSTSVTEENFHDYDLNALIMKPFSRIEILKQIQQLLQK